MSLQTKKAKEEILKWCQTATSGYKNVKITDFTTSFKDGIALCSIIHKYEPDLIKLEDLSPDTPDDNLEFALDVAVDKLEVPTELTAKDFIIEDSGKMKEFYKVICALFKRFNQNSESLNAPKKKQR